MFKLFGFKDVEKSKIEHEKNLTNLEESIKRQNDETLKANLACEHEVDFAKMDAFSIERIMYHDNNYKTLIGYMFNEHIKSWVLECSVEEHIRLVKKFREYQKDIYMK